MTTNLPATLQSQLALTDATTFRSFLLDPASLTPSVEAESSLKPTERLKALAAQTVATEHGRMGMLDAILATMTQAALRGERWAVEKIYNELQHDGVHKVQTLNLHSDFKQEYEDILKEMKMEQSTVNSTATEIAPERLTHAQNASAATYTAEDAELLFSEALRRFDE